MFWVISVYFNVRNILSKSGTFPPGHPVYNVVPEDGLDIPKHVEHPKIKTSYKNLCILLVHFHISTIRYSLGDEYSLVYVLSIGLDSCA